MKQHLYTDAMLAIFPIQEFLATDEELMNPNMDEERINNPAVFPHYLAIQNAPELGRFEN
jgi:4-alpha-glucanotransferase